MTWLHKVLPFLTWKINGKTIRGDLTAGVTVALLLIPQSMAYAQLAGLPAHYGLYASLLPAIVGVLWGSSMHLVTGPVAITSLITASTLAHNAQIGSDEFISLAILLAFLAGVIQLAMGLFKLGAFVNFLSHPVISGFTNAAAIIIGLSQLNKLLGLPMNHSKHFLNDVWAVVQQIGDAHILTIIMGFSALVIMWGFRKYYPKMPGILIAIIITTIVSQAIGFEDMGGKVVGEIPASLPDLKLPEFSWNNTMMLLSGAIIIAVVGFMEAISSAKIISIKTKQRINPDQELIGQGLAKIAGSFTQAYPSSGSFSRSALNLRAGAKTGMSSVFTVAIVLITLLYLTPMLYHLPHAVLAAVVIMAVTLLIDPSAIKHSWQVNKYNGTAAIVTFIATLAFAPYLGNALVIGASLSIIFYIYQSMHPHISLLGRHKDGYLHCIKEHDLPKNKEIVIIRFDDSLYFANVSYFEDAILTSLSDHPDAKYILIVSNGINQMDASGEASIRKIIEKLKEDEITVVFSGIKHQVLKVMKRSGLLDIIGSKNIYLTPNMALDAINQRIKDTKSE